MSRIEEKDNVVLLQVVSEAFSLPYFIGGQFGYFQKKGIKQYIACNYSRFLDKYAKKVDIPYFPVPIKRTINPVIDLVAIWKLFFIIKRNKVNVVFGHSPKGALVAMIAAFLSGVKRRVYFRHGLVFETATGAKRSLLVLVERLVTSFATQVVDVSPSVLSKVKAEKIDISKDIMLSKGTCNGVDVDRFNMEVNRPDPVLKKTLQIPENAFVVGFVGRLVKDKGIVELIESWKMLSVAYPHMRLLLVGPFDTRDGLSDALRNDITIMSSVIHVDFTEDVVPYYQLMDLLILPSYREGFPTVVLEAGAMGIPAVATAVTGCIDAVIDGVTGLFTTHDVKDIAEKILYYYQMPATRMLHGQQANSHIRTYFRQQLIWEEIERRLLN